MSSGNKDALDQRKNVGIGRTDAQIREQYEVEKELANSLKLASKLERMSLYTALYEELYRRIPHHPQLTQKASPEEMAEHMRGQMNLFSRLLKPDTVYLEIGPGDCALVFEVAKQVKSAIGVDVSETITKARSIPSNFQLIISDGSSIPVQQNSVHIAYSNQLMEHLHPDDALEQLKNVYRALMPGGRYLCVTPNRLNGPHDISRAFDSEATGFHLKEYTVTELAGLFRKSGFVKVHQYLGAKGHFVRAPIFISILCEKFLTQFPSHLRRKLAALPIIRHLIEIRLVGEKGS